MSPALDQYFLSYVNKTKWTDPNSKNTKSKKYMFLKNCINVFLW